MTPFLPSSTYDAFGDVPCCGLGGFMAWRKPQQTARVLQTLRDRVDEYSQIAENSLRNSVAKSLAATAGDGRSVAASGSHGNSDWHFYTYCASCVSQFQRLGIRQAEHLLPLILGVNETPRRGALAVANRVLGKLR